MKLSKHAWAVWGIALFFTIALMILIPFVRTAAWWIAAVGTVLMFGLCAFTFVRAFRQDDTLESKVLGWPIFKVGYTALLVQWVLGAILMGLAFFCPAWVAIITELVVFTVAALCLTVKDAAREAVTQLEVKVENNTAAWKSIRAKAMALAAQTNHPAMQKLAEEIRMADPTPTSIDAQVAEMIEQLKEHADDEHIKQVFQLIENRKVLAKMEK